MRRRHLSRVEVRGSGPPRQRRGAGGSPARAPDQRGNGSADVDARFGNPTHAHRASGDHARLRRPRPGDVEYTVLDNTRFRLAFGTPVPLEHGLRKTYESFASAAADQESNLEPRPDHASSAQ